MIKLTEGDILAVDAQALVNTVNCVGVMGRGIALQFRNQFPENYAEYKAACDNKELHPGKVLVHRTMRLNPLYIINFPTKNHWKGKSRIEYIESGLKSLVQEVKEREIKSIAIPPLGCGLGGLRWSDVRPRIERAFSELPDVEVILFEPRDEKPSLDLVKQKEPPKMTEGRAALLGLMQRYLAALMDPFVTLLEIHKLMYFMQEAGEPLKLRYVKAPYGPFAENLRHVLSKLEGHFIYGYAVGEDTPTKQIELVPDATTQAFDFITQHPKTQQRFDRVAELVEGFETPFGMELLSTVHWVATREGASTVDEVIEKTHAWNDRKQMFDPKQIRIAFRILQRKGWLNNSDSQNYGSTTDTLDLTARIGGQFSLPEPQK
jgi:O-acetyl-ADP-ribose deacetylase (regulator of RNase III)